MKRFALCAFLALAATLPSKATTVTFAAASSGTARQVVENNGVTADPAGSLVLVGTFSTVGNFSYNPAASFNTNYNNLFSEGGFAQFSLAQPGNGASEVSGTPTFEINTGFGLSQISGSIADNNGAVGSGQDASFFDNKQVYVIVFNGSTVGASTQMGVFTSTAWTFKANNDGLGGDTGTYATSTATTVTAVGGAGSVNSSPNQLELAAAPEPSAWLSIIGGAGVLFHLRRRNRSAVKL